MQRLSVRRAAPHIVSALDREGGACEWLRKLKQSRQRFGSRALSRVWDTAWMLDRRTRSCPPSERASFLQTDDACERGARHLASWFHDHQTGDGRAAAAMLAEPPPGVRLIAPAWLAREAKGRSHKRPRRAERRAEKYGMIDAGALSKQRELLA